MMPLGEEVQYEPLGRGFAWPALEIRRAFAQENEPEAVPRPRLLRDSVELSLKLHHVAVRRKDLMELVIEEPRHAY